MVSVSDLRLDDSRPSPAAGWREKWRTTFAEILGQDALDVVCRLTLVILVLHPSAGTGISWYQKVVTVPWCTAAFIYPPWQRSPWFWLPLAIFRFVSVNSYDWAYANNHDCLTTYWCLAIACSLWLKDPMAAVAYNGRLLIGLVFLVATLWKLSSPEYMSGKMFEYLLYHDNRFFEIARVFGDLTLRVGELDHVVYNKMAALSESISLRDDRFYRVLAKVLTWWTILIEGTIAILFLVKRSHKWAIFGDLALLLFAVTTYPMVGVYSFAWLLSVLGLAQCPLEYRRLRFVYMIMPLYAFIFVNGELKVFLFSLFA
jgi:hypothetical protein